MRNDPAALVQAGPAEVAAAEGEGEAGADDPRGAAAAEAAGGVRLIEDVFFRAVLGGRADKVVASARAHRAAPCRAAPAPPWRRATPPGEHQNKIGTKFITA